MQQAHGPSGARLALCVALLAMLAGSQPAAAARPAPKPPAAAGGFVDHFDVLDTSRWSRADGWTNGSPFDNAWLADHVLYSGGRLELQLDDAAALGEPYASGELRSNAYYGYGCYEASFKPIAVPGVVTSLFTFAGPFDNGGNGKHNEIDIEFLGNQPRRVQFNFWTNDDAYATSNELLLDLGFDPAAAYHRYGFRWTATGIEWFVDGQLVHAVNDSTGNPTPKATESLQKIMVNAWPVDETAVLWAGQFVYPGAPLRASYEWVRHIAGADCSLLDPPANPQPPSGDATRMHVQAIGLSLDSKRTQVIARVGVVDGLGRPVAGVAVSGNWSGAITSGDTYRTTDATGTATFYSSRSRSAGTVGFCVASLSHSSLAYDAGGNLETCDSITK
jgi:beta-glucanase (GH16 family)